MATTTVAPIEFDAPPAFGPIYKKILFGGKRKGFRQGDQMPQIAAHCAGVKPDLDNLRAYEQVIGLPRSSRLPLLYPHVLTGSLHLAIMTQEEFPLSMMGAVHLRNHVLEHRPLGEGESFDVLCTLDSHRVAKAGIEMDVSTVLADGSGERVWESVSTYLVRGKFGEPDEAPARANIDESVPEQEVASWFVPAGTGRRYAKVCGDYNPIHIHPLTAKLFGFKRDIVHGMWAAGVCLAKLGEFNRAGAVRCDILFKGPTFMKSKVVLKKGEAGSGERFDLFCGGNPRPVISGWRRTPGAEGNYL